MQNLGTFPEVLKSGIASVIYLVVLLGRTPENISDGELSSNSSGLNIVNYCCKNLHPRCLGMFNRYVTFKGGRGDNPFCYGALLEGEGGSSDTVT